MAIYLGNAGLIELKRTSDSEFYSPLEISDVNTTRQRFSFDYPTGSIVTGDRLLIKRTDGGNLQLVSGHNFEDGMWYANVDSVGGIRLYNTFFDAVNDITASVISLATPTEQQQISVKIFNRDYRYIAQVSSYEITCSRETVDLTSLGEEHRKNYANGLISGQGSLSCYWDYEARGGDLPPVLDPTSTPEMAQYFYNLVLRAQAGASFGARFYLKARTQVAVNAESVANDSLWIEADCIVTNVAMNFTPTDTLTAQIDFVTTGPTTIGIGSVGGKILKEDSFLLLREDGEPLVQEEPDL